MASLPVEFIMCGQIRWTDIAHRELIADVPLRLGAEDHFADLTANSRKASESQNMIKSDGSRMFRRGFV